jgi:hypothetical protein
MTPRIAPGGIGPSSSAARQDLPTLQLLPALEEIALSTAPVPETAPLLEKEVGFMT